MTVVASASGTRIDCDRCGLHAVVPELSIGLLRRDAGFVSVGGADLCPECAGEVASPEPAETALSR
jgi:hypothetical protein